MRTRTRLTSPPGEEPAAGEALETRAPERYTPALALPREPDVPGRYRRVFVTLAAVVLLGAAGWALLQLAASEQSEDPSLDPEPATAPATAPAEPQVPATQAPAEPSPGPTG